MDHSAGSDIPDKRNLWEYPWKYKESFIIAFGILLIGFILEYFIGDNNIWLPTWPTNLIIILAFWGYFIFLDRYVKHPLIKWLSSTPAAISSISVFTFLILLMGFIAQSNDSPDSFLTRIGLTNVTGSWPYLLTALYLMVILGLTISRRFLPLTIKNFAFLLNHGGLWLVIAAASLGSADSWKMSMVLTENEETNIARDYKTGNIYEMPFNLELLDFHIEEFPPNIGLLDNQSRTLVFKKGDKLFEVKEGGEDKIGDWDVKIEKYYPSAIKEMDTFVSRDVVGAVHAVYIKARNLKTNKEIEGWITNGSMVYDPEFLILDVGHSLVMTIPSPKDYSSRINTIYPGGEEEEVFIEVNKPVNISGWTVYQVSYDESMGKWSTVSIVELVRDPWLPVVYIGIFMILAGSLYLAWMGRKKN